MTLYIIVNIIVIRIWNKIADTTKHCTCSKADKLAKSCQAEVFGKTRNILVLRFAIFFAVLCEIFTILHIGFTNHKQAVCFKFLTSSFCLKWTESSGSILCDKVRGKISHIISKRSEEGILHVDYLCFSLAGKNIGGMQVAVNQAFSLRHKKMSQFLSC